MSSSLQDISLSDFQLQLISKTKELFPLIPDKLNLTPYLLHSHAVSAYDAVTQLSRALTNSIECGTYENQTLLQSILRYNILVGLHDYTRSIIRNQNVTQEQIQNIEIPLYVLCSRRYQLS